MKNLIIKTWIILALTSPAITVIAATTSFSTNNNETDVNHSNHISPAVDENNIFTINYINTTTFADTLTTDAQRKGLDFSGKEKGINKAGIKRTEYERKGWDGTVKGSGKGINQAGLKRNDADANKTSMIVPQTGKVNPKNGLKVSVMGSGQITSDGTPIIVGKTVRGSLFSDKVKKISSKNTFVDVRITQTESGDMGNAVTDENGNFTIELNHDTLHTIALNGVEYGKIKLTESKGWDGTVKGNSKGINEAGIKRTENQRKDLDGTVKGGNIQEKSINGINNGMPNRISMNITVAKQTQGATFGEKVNAGMINVTLVKDGCVVIFPDNEGYRVNTAIQCITKLTTEEYGKVNAGLHAAGGALAQGASLLGGALPGGAIISAAISSVGNLAGAGGGAAAASYAATGRVARDSKDNDCDDKADILASVTPLTGTIGGITGGAVAGKAKTSDKVWEVGDQDCDGTAELADGDYELSFVVIEKAASGLKDTLKTQVKIQFSSISNVLKTKHDTAKNSVSNIR